MDGGFGAICPREKFCPHYQLKRCQRTNNRSLKPREHPAEDRDPFGVDETSHLFAHELPMNSQDVPVGWILNGDLDSEPSQELVECRWNKQQK